MSAGIPTYIDAHWSAGYGSYGMRYLYIRPNVDCFNKSRKVRGFCDKEVFEKAEKIINKWYNPLNLYEIDGRIIASNNEHNALKEYWKVCEYDKMKQPFPVKFLQSIYSGI